MYFSAIDILIVGPIYDKPPAKKDPQYNHNAGQQNKNVVKNTKNYKKWMENGHLMA